MADHKPHEWEKKILIDAHAEISLPVRFWRDAERYAADLEREAVDLIDFIRDHRSRDGYSIDIVRTYETQCKFCGYSEDFGDEEPSCCDEAINVWRSRSPKTETST